MIKLINHLFGTELIRDNFYLSQYKNIIFETDDMNMVKILIPVRLMYNFDIYNIDFKLENINSLENIEEPYMFISKYQILWDKLYLENINA
jgi:hypothetical protein